MHLLTLENTPIYEQLQLEEALLRGTHLDFCILSKGSPKAIVMGISGKPETLIHLDKAEQDLIPVIQRFSGGGTVIIDEQTVFISFIVSKNTIPIMPYPEPILQWMEKLYIRSWNIPEFKLLENDFVVGSLKCGGNAQYIQKDRWLIHTSFLWDYQKENMDYLRMPAKRPIYRQDREHNDFLCRLKSFFPTQNDFVQKFKNELHRSFDVKEVDLKDLKWEEHRKSVKKIR